MFPDTLAMHVLRHKAVTHHSRRALSLPARTSKRPRGERLAIASSGPATLPYRPSLRRSIKPNLAIGGDSAVADRCSVRTRVSPGCAAPKNNAYGAGPFWLESVIVLLDGLDRLAAARIRCPQQAEDIGLHPFTS